MFKKIVIIISGIIGLAVVIFFVWHFLLSIYEVKFYNNFPDKNLEANSKYYLLCSGINSFGWRLNWRDINPSINILEGDSLVEIKKVSNNKYEFLTGEGEGSFTFEISSAFSLNPTRFTLHIIQKQ